MDNTLFQIVTELARLQNLVVEQEQHISEATRLNEFLSAENERLKARVQELELALQSVKAARESDHQSEVVDGANANPKRANP